MKGKYAAKADTRLKVLESEALREATAKIKDLEAELKQARQERNVSQAKMTSKAMEAAAAMSAREKSNLRDKIASLEHQAAEQRIRNAVLTWEVMHRNRFDRPSPAKLLGITLITEAQLEEAPESREELKDSIDYWRSVHWEIAGIFFCDYDEILRFFRVVEGYTWGIAGDRKILGGSARENTRNLRKGKIRDHMMRRNRGLREHYDCIWKARLAGGVEPVKHLRDFISEPPKDGVERMVESLKTHG